MPKFNNFLWSLLPACLWKFISYIIFSQLHMITLQSFTKILLRDLVSVKLAILVLSPCFPKNYAYIICDNQVKEWVPNLYIKKKVNIKKK